MLACLTCLVSMTACDSSGSDTEVSSKRSNLSTTTKGKEFTLKSGISRDEIGAQLARWGAGRIDAAYELPWASVDGKSRGYHEYYNLADGTCLQLEIQSEESGDKVVGFAIGPSGKSYVDKLVWFSDDKLGLISRSASITLSGEAVGGNRQ